MKGFKLFTAIFPVSVYTAMILKFGKIHHDFDRDFTVKDYSFSSPETIVETKCCWCWDLAEFIELYCDKNEIPYKSYFMEYLSDDMHQTHSQVFIMKHGVPHLTIVWVLHLAIHVMTL